MDRVLKSGVVPPAGDSDRAPLPAVGDLTLRVISAPITDSLATLSAALQSLVPHRALAQLSPTCPYAPFQVLGEVPTGIGTLTALDLAALRPRSGSGTNVAVRTLKSEPIAVLTSEQSDPPAVLLVMGAEPATTSAEGLTAAKALWDLLTAHRVGMQADLDPARLTVSRAAAAARSSTIAELGDAHTVALGSILRVLRSRHLGPAEAVALASDLAASAVTELRDRAEVDQEFSDQRSAAAFDQLANSIRRTLRPRGVRLDVRRPEQEDGADRMLAHDIVAATSATVRAVVHALIEPPANAEESDVTRIHLSWVVGDGELRATIRDDGPGIISRETMPTQQLEGRIQALGGRIRVEALPNWGTTVSVSAPLVANPEHGDTLSVLTDRERDVLQHLADGHRNRQIALELNLSESTVKFHVKRIFAKLDVTSRGEAAAYVHRVRVT